MIFGRNLFVCFAALIASFSVAIAASAFDARDMELYMQHESARRKALDNLLQMVRATEVGDELTLGDLLDKIEGDITWESLFKGAEKLQPIRHHANGDTEVVLRISFETLKANIAALIEERLPEEGIDLDAVVFKVEMVDGYIITRGTEKRIRRGDAPVAGPPSRLPGWANVTAQERAAIERKMAVEIRDSIRQAVSTEFAEYLDQVEADAFADKIVAKILPESKAYLPDGIIEMSMIIDPRRIESILEREDSPFSLEDGDRLIETLTNLFGWSFEARTYKHVDGRDVGDFEKLEQYIPLEQDDFPATIRRPGAAAPAPDFRGFEMPIEF